MTKPHTMKAASLLGPVGAGTDGGGVRDLLGKLLPSTGVERDTFELRAGPFLGRQLRVVRWEGTEAISDTFRVDCTVVAPFGPEVVVPVLMGQSGCFTMQVPGGPAREMQGILASVVALGARAADDLYLYRLRLVPRLWLLKQTRASRIFQNRTVQSIVSAVLGKHGVPCRWALNRALPVREYCVQYEESDYEFVRRLLSEEGIYFYFEHPKGLAGELSALAHAAVDVGTLVGMLEASDHNFSSAFEELGLTEMVVFADGADFVPLGHAISETNPGIQMLTRGGTVTATRRIIPTLPFRDAEGMFVQEEHVSRFERGRTLGPKACAVREFSSAKPRQTSTERWDHGRGDPKKATKSQVAALAADVMRGHLPFPEIPALGMDPVTYEYGDHEGTAYFEPTALRAKRLLEAVRRKTSFASGESNSRRVSAGAHFELADHSVATLNADYVVTKVRHVGVTPEVMNATSPVDVYTNKFECLPASHVPRPKRRPRARRQVAETALVVGPVDQEIHTDAEGRIKVQFHWDRQGKMNESSSCWLRLSQVWAGAGFGVQFIPRVGMEVVVTFLHGDVDRPIVTGCVSNTLNMPPFSLPEERRISGIRTRTTPPGDVAHELSFDDTKGVETLRMRSVYATELTTGYAHRVRVGSHSPANPTGEGYLSEEVTTDRICSVGRDSRETIRRNSLSEIHGDRTMLTAGEATSRAVGAMRTATGGSFYLSIGQAYIAEIAATERTTVSGDSTHDVFGCRAEFTERDTTRTTHGSETVTIGEAYALSAVRQIRFEALEGIRVTCGPSSLSITREGIVLEGPMVQVNATEAARLLAPSASLSLEPGLLDIHTKDGISLTSGSQVTSTAGDAVLTLLASDTSISATGDTVNLAGADASLTLGDRADLLGSTVHINDPSTCVVSNAANATPLELRTSYVDLCLTRDDGTAVEGARFVLVMSNGEELLGALNRHGRAHVAVIPGDCQVTFPEYDGAAWH